MTTLNSKILHINSKLDQLETLNSHVAYMESELRELSNKMEVINTEITNMQFNEEMEERKTILENIFTHFANKSVDINKNDLLLSKFKEFKSLEGEYKIIEDQIKKTNNKLSEIRDYQNQLSSLLNQKEWTIRNLHSDEATNIVIISEKMMHLQAKISSYKIEIINLSQIISLINKSMYLIHNIITSGKMEYFGTYDDSSYLKKKIIDDLTKIRILANNEQHALKLEDALTIGISAKIKSYFEQINLFCANFIEMEVNDFKIRRNLEDLKINGNTLNQEIKAFEKYINTELERLKSGIEECQTEKQNAILSVVIIEENMANNKK